MLHVLQALLLASLCFISQSSFCDIGPSWDLAFEDDFSGSELNNSNWNIVVGNEDVGSCRDALCTASAVSVSGGSLILNTTDTPTSFNGVTYNFTTGAINSKGKQHWNRSQTFRLCVTAELPGGGPMGNGNGDVGEG